MPPTKSSIDAYFKPTGTAIGKRKRSDEIAAGTSSGKESTAQESNPREPLAEIANFNGKAKTAQRQPAKRIKASSDGAKVKPPANWEEVYGLTKEMRAKTPAPVDTYGSACLSNTTDSAQDQRFQTLVGLMLSAQTKDTITGAVMKNLHENLPGGLNVESVLAVSPETLNRLISKATYHDKKTQYIKNTASVLKSRFSSDIPSTIAGLVSLPGVGPKMAHLTMSIAWGRNEGISVDVHVHRITNLWGWHEPPTKTPEETRLRLEAWLPKDKWYEINGLLVGFGQTICTPAARKCGVCALAEKGLCPGAVVGKKVNKATERKKVEAGQGGAETKEEADVRVENITADAVDW